MMKIAVIVLSVAFLLASAYAALIIAAPQVIAGSSYEARSGQPLDRAQDAASVATLLEETRRLGVFAATTAILVWFVLFFSFRKAERWAWWLFLIIAAIVWGYGIITNAIEGDNLNLILHSVCAVINFVGLFLPVKAFFGKK
jgi:hypothetical protein